MIDIQEDFNDFYKMYPRGYCLFLLAGSDKSILFGPDLDYSFKTSALASKSGCARISSFLRETLRPQIMLNTQAENTQLFMIFYCARKTASEGEAERIAYNFQNLFNHEVLRNKGLCDNPNHAMVPIHLREVVYRGHTNGLGLDKKKEFIYLIHNYQDNFDQDNEVLPFCVKRGCDVEALYKPFKRTINDKQNFGILSLLALLSTLVMAVLPFIICFF